MAGVVKREPIELDTSASSAELLMMEGACLILPEQPPPDLSSHHEQEQQDQQIDGGHNQHMMQTDDDPLLQETIQALMNDSGGLEPVPGGVGGLNSVHDHDSERQYECNFCGKLFTRSNTLSYHLKVHNDEKPYKCTSCDKAFREQYRLNKHQRTHLKDLQDEEEEEPSQDSGKSAEDEDYNTGDSDRFFRNYELQDDTAAMKLEPDISLTVDGSSTNQATSSSNSDNDVRYQIIEERIKSLQREVHLVNQNLNRVETKLDGLTKIMAIFVNKFDEVDQQANVANSSNAAAMIPIPTPLISVPIENLQNFQTQPTAVSQQHSQPPTPVPSQSIQMVQATPMPTAVRVQSSPSIAQQQPQQLQQQQLPPTRQLDNSNFLGGLDATVTALANNLGVAVPQQGATVYNGKNDAFPEMPELPIRTVNDFLDLNDHCTDNEQFLLQMMIRLHQEMDNAQPHQRNIKKMLEALVTYDVLCQFSWSGKSAINGQYTKYVFGNSVGIIDLLTKTLNLGKSAAEVEANRKPIFIAIQNVIKHSKQNMLRDSRKRRDSGLSAYPPVGGAVHCGVDRQLRQPEPIPKQHYQIKLEQQDFQYYD